MLLLPHRSPTYETHFPPQPNGKDRDGNQHRAQGKSEPGECEPAARSCFAHGAYTPERAGNALRLNFLIRCNVLAFVGPFTIHVIATSGIGVVHIDASGKSCPNRLRAFARSASPGSITAMKHTASSPRYRLQNGISLIVPAMGLKPSPSGETF